MHNPIRIAVVAILTLSLAGPALASGEGHDHSKMEHGSSGHQEMDHSGHLGDNIRETTVDGYRLAYHLIDMREKMKGMKGMAGHDMSKMPTHHLMFYIQGPDGKQVGDAQVGFKVEGAGGEQQVMAMGMKMGAEVGFGADLSLKAGEEYEIKSKAVFGAATLRDEFKYRVP